MMPPPPMSTIHYLYHPQAFAPSPSFSTFSARNETKTDMDIKNEPNGTTYY